MKRIITFLLVIIIFSSAILLNGTQLGGAENTGPSAIPTLVTLPEFFPDYPVAFFNPIFAAVVFYNNNSVNIYEPPFLSKGISPSTIRFLDIDLNDFIIKENNTISYELTLSLNNAVWLTNEFSYLYSNKPLRMEPLRNPFSIFDHDLRVGIELPYNMFQGTTFPVQLELLMRFVRNNRINSFLGISHNFLGQSSSTSYIKHSETRATLIDNNLVLSDLEDSRLRIHFSIRNIDPTINATVDIERLIINGEEVHVGEWYGPSRNVIVGDHEDPSRDPIPPQDEDDEEHPGEEEPPTPVPPIVTPPSPPIEEEEYEEEEYNYNEQQQEQQTEQENNNNIEQQQPIREEREEQEQLPPSHREPPVINNNIASRLREIITINQHGQVTIGSSIFNFDPEEFGAPHINNLGVSVLPARMILSILLNANPHDNTMFIWDYISTQFSVDPSGYDVIFEVDSPIMLVSGIARQIFSGTGERAFLTAPYIDIWQNNRLFVPTRTIAEVLGFNVNWNAENALVTLTPVNY